VQREWIDFVEIFAPVAKFQSITCLIAIAAYCGLDLELIDVVTALLNPDAEQEIYSHVFQGLKVPEEFKKGASCPSSGESTLWSQASSENLERCSRCNAASCQLYSDPGL
jgi:hypothetical protein